jgi:hypothetical protein
VYIWKNLQCELCKTNFPSYLNFNGRQYDTVEIPKPEPPYILMDILSREKNVSRGIHIINMSGTQEIKMGRGSDSDVRIQDISVSRSHAQITLHKSNFYLDDKGSKFGTLVLAKNRIEVAADKLNKIAMQVNRTVFTFYVKKANSFSFGCCSAKAKRQKDVEINQKVLAPEIKFKSNIEQPEENKQEAHSEIIRPSHQIHYCPAQFHMANINHINNRINQNNLPNREGDNELEPELQHIDDMNHHADRHPDEEAELEHGAHLQQFNSRSNEEIPNEWNE